MTTPGASARPSFCTSCGAPARGARFCTSCGAALAAPVAVVDDSATQVIARPPAAPEDAVTQVVPRPESPSPELAQPEPQEAGAEPDGHPAMWFDESAGTGVYADGHRTEDAYGAAPYDEAAYAESPYDDEPPAPRRRRGRILTAAFLALVVLGVAGFFGYQYVRDGDVRTALAASTKEYNAVVEQLTAADDVATISVAARRASAAADVVERERERVEDADTARAKAAEAQLEAEHDVLTAAAALATLADDPLQTWGDAHRELRAAVSEEQETREQLEKQDEGAAGRIADGDEMLDALTATVGSALAEDAAGGAVSALDRVADAQKTSQLREVGEDAVAQQDAVASVARALDRGSGREVLAAYGEVLAALGGLTDVTPADASSWSDVRSDVEVAADRLASAAGPQGSRVRTALADALEGGDAVVTRAERGYAEWQQARDAAEALIAAERTTLESYEQEVNAQMEDYATGREALGDFTDELEAGTADLYDAAAVFSSAVGDRESIGFGLRNVPQPDGVQAQHDALLGLVDRGISAATAGYDGVTEATSCFDPADCPDYTETAGWRTFLKESEEISKQYAPVLTGWQKAVAGARTALEARSLPTEPDL